jgi:hypothetical protein
VCVEVDGQWFLAERRQAAPDGRADQVGMGGRRCGDHDAIGIVQRRVDGRGRLGTHLGRDVHSPRRVGIRDHQAVHPGRIRQQPCVEPPDPPCAQERDPHGRSSPAPRPASGRVDPGTVGARGQLDETR